MTGDVMSIWGGCNVDPPRRCNVGGCNVLFSCICKGAIIESGRTACITARPIDISFTFLSFATNNSLSRIRNFTGT